MPAAAVCRTSVYWLDAGASGFFHYKDMLLV